MMLELPLNTQKYFYMAKYTLRTDLKGREVLKHQIKNNANYFPTAQQINTLRPC